MKKIQTLGQSIDTILKQVPDLDGLPEKNPDSNQCPECDGYGHVIDEDGRARPCICVKKEIVVSGIERARIPGRFAQQSLDTFVPKNNSLKKKLTFVRQYIRDYSLENTKGIYICGGTGAGKTHLATGILKGLIERGFDGVFYNVVDLLDAIRSTYDPQQPAAPKGRLMKDLERQIFVLDDFGTQKTSAWVADRLYSLINRRYQDCKTLIITSNKSFDELLMIKERPLASRIRDMCVELEVKADDFRSPERKSGT